MQGFLSELGKRLAGRWVHVALPGALFLTAAWVAGVLGQRHAVDTDRLVRRLDAVVSGLTGTELLVRGALFAAGAFAVGLLAQVVGELLRSLWTERWPWPLGWAERAAVRVRLAADRRGAPAGTLARYLPARATRAADRLRLAHERVDVQYGAHLGLLWPRLWLMLTADERAPIEAGREAMHNAAILAGWGGALVCLGGWWWPAAVVGAVVVATARQRMNAATAAVADLAEAAVDTQQATLADRFGVPAPGGQISRDDFLQINDRLAKGA